MRVKKKSRVIALLKRWNRELKIQNALGTGGNNFTVIYNVGDVIRTDKSMTVRALHYFHAAAICGGFHPDATSIACGPAGWSKSLGWGLYTMDGYPPKEVTLEELEAR